MKQRNNPDNGGNSNDLSSRRAAIALAVAGALSMGAGSPQGTKAADGVRGDRPNLASTNFQRGHLIYLTKDDGNVRFSDEGPDARPDPERTVVELTQEELESLNRTTDSLGYPVVEHVEGTGTPAVSIPRGEPGATSTIPISRIESPSGLQYFSSASAFDPDRLEQTTNDRTNMVIASGDGEFGSADASAGADEIQPVSTLTMPASGHPEIIGDRMRFEGTIARGERITVWVPYRGISNSTGDVEMKVVIPDISAGITVTVNGITLPNEQTFNVAETNGGEIPVELQLSDAWGGTAVVAILQKRDGTFIHGAGIDLDIPEGLTEEGSATAMSLEEVQKKYHIVDLDQFLK